MSSLKAVYYQTRKYFANITRITVKNSMLISTMVFLFFQGISYAVPPEYEFGLSEPCIEENQPKGLRIGRYPVDYAAVGDTFTYSLRRSGTDDDTSAFSIDSNNVWLTTSKVFDYEQEKKKYEVLVVATNQNGEEATISVYLYIKNANDNPPEFSEGRSTTRVIPENTPSDRLIGRQLSATDPDWSDKNTDPLSGPHGDREPLCITNLDPLRYSLEGPDAESFRINNVTGQLLTSKPLDYETKNSYNVTVKVTDGKFTDIIDVAIIVTNVKDPAPPSILKDSSLAAAVRETLGLAPNARITQQMMRRLTSLDATDRQITDLTGLEHATRLEQLDLSDNEIRNLNPLAGLTKLKRLVISDNQIRNVSPLAGLTQLEHLGLSRNQISNVKPLAGLTKLEWLGLHENQIRNVRPLAGLTQLVGLGLSRNQISNIRPLSGLTQLESLSLRANQIRDVSPLAQLTRLKQLWLDQNNIRDVTPLSKLVNLEWLFLSGNPIKDTSPLAKLTKLTNVDIEISREPVVHVGPAQRPPMYWIDAKTGTLHRLVGAEVEDFLPEVQNATSLTVDATGNKIYWTEQIGRNRGNVKRANLDGSNVQTLATVNSVPNSIAIDPMRSMLYWTNSRGRIQRSHLNGKQLRNLVQNLDSPDNITVDVAGAKLYWTEASGRIRRSNLNGKSIQNIASGLGSIDGIAIHGNMIYYGSTLTGESRRILGRTNLNGSNLRTIILLGGVLSGITVDPVGKKIYWTETHGNMWRSNLNGRNIKEVVSGLTSPARLVLGSSSAATAAAAANSLLTSSEIPTPDATDLLANYPNPFNPETWIPYQLAKPADVTVTIYAVNGEIVRRLVLGHQAAGVYQSKSRAAYWDGRNALGEPVASGVYFYTLTAGNFTATRKMLIRK